MIHFIPPTILLFRHYNHKSYTAQTPPEKFTNIDFSIGKIQLISQGTSETPLPLSCDWEPAPSIYIHNIDSSQDDINLSAKRTYCFIGGLLAMILAAKKLSECSSDDEVLYIRNKDIPKTLMSGHQFHLHPSEWSTKDCGFKNLFKTLLQGLSLIKQDDPTDLENYSYLHMSLRIKDWIDNPALQLRIFTGCFYQRIKHSMTSNSLGVSKQDQWLCDAVAQSRKTHQELSDKIEMEMGKPTFSPTGRIYWSPNKEKMELKEKIWRELKIPVEKISTEDKLHLTLLKKDSPLYILKILSDGKFYPETPERILQYLTKKYPNFTAIEANVTDIFLNHQNDARAIKMTRIDNGEIIQQDISSLFGSMGHNNVFKKSTWTGKWKPLWHEISVTGVSATWKCTLTRQELQERWNKPLLSNEEIHQCINKIMPAANLSNLHVTSWDCTIQNDAVVMMVRASEGANVNSTIAFKNDLINMSHNLDSYFMGKWELESVGSCSRKTWSSNIPEVIELSDNVKFVHGQSGIGYSFSGVDEENLKHP
jgi:hypothetical protein